MTKYAVVKNGIVENVIIADATFVAGLEDVTAVSLPDSSLVSAGWLYNGSTFAQPAAPVVPPAAHDWYIDIGPFFDRFGSAKMAVLTSADAGVRAIIEDTKVRKWIDLKNSSVPTSIDYIITKVPSVTSALKTSILTAPVTPEENLAVRKLFFS